MSLKCQFAAVLCSSGLAYRLAGRTPRVAFMNLACRWKDRRARISAGVEDFHGYLVIGIISPKYLLLWYFSTTSQILRPQNHREMRCQPSRRFKIRSFCVETSRGNILPRGGKAVWMRVFLLPPNPSTWPEDLT